MLQEDISFLQIVSTVTSQFGCSILDVDLEERVVSITCPGGKEQEVECAMAIGEILEEGGICA